ncbi:hypothetical protein ETD86_48570 [Nonomuraea turkmeniaca]|uniref:WD40 repeat domain-containing protein n=1 Tax=Nonomuraea turkmeniaca TaxID=103838 RepID=A0A5S4EXN6_9ACTN|nr:hypothetical protein [Nonomuraea turkmeniaca]TMR08263.1 hypothetical protein ETD86_48570 [Nonomuraea turkmeniaca]
MRTKIVATLTAALVTLVGAPVAAPVAGAVAGPAVAHADPHHDSIRYASIKSCARENEQPRPCGAWRLVMHSGEQTTLRDAQGVALNAKGKSTRYLPAAIAVSGNGQKVAYFTTTGRLAVRTLGGGVKLLPKDALPRIGQDQVSLVLSDDGGRLAALFSDDKPHATRVFDTDTGARLGTLPGHLGVQGFSDDGDELLGTVDAEESVTDLLVYSDTGKQLVRATPPQVVASNGPQALAADGRTVANIVQGDKPELVLYDMESDQVTDRKKIKLPTGDINMIDWTGDAQVTLHLVRYLSNSTRMTVVQIDTRTGAVKVRDRYTVLKDTFVFAACGG